MSNKNKTPKEGGDYYDSSTRAVDSSSELDSSNVLDSKLQALTNYHRSPLCIKRRVRALKKLQYETVKIDAEFYKELLDLEMKFDAKHQNIFEKRKEIVLGSKEPTEEECDWPTDDDEEVDQLSESVQQKVAVNDENNGHESSTRERGIPDFWLKAMQSVSQLDQMIQEHDIDILKYLEDIKCVLISGDEPGFTLEFHFAENSYFTNRVLKKRYFFNYDISAEDPFDYEGPEIVRTKGCAINWNQGKNATVKVIKKVQKKKGNDAKRTITKTVKKDSFFNFFDPPLDTLTDDVDNDTELLLEEDFKIGQFIRESLIPRAVLYYTGEGIDPDEDDDDEDDDDDADDSDEDNEDEEDSSHHHHRGRHHGDSRGSKPAPTTDGAGEQSDCKQQ